MADLIVEGPKLKQKKESYFSFGDDQAPVTLPYIPSWLQQTQVMYSKLPMLHAPSGTITLFTTGLCEKLHYTPSDLEFDCSANEFFLEYKSLHDPHLKNLYCQARTVKRLIKQGFITPELKVKCSLEDFNIYHQYLKKMKLNRLNQKHKRQMDQGREEKLYQAKRKKDQPSERDKRGAAARERKAANVKEEHQRLINYLERDELKRAKLLKERQLQRGIVGAQKSLQSERRRIAHIELDLQERQRKASILQKREEKEEGCARRLREQKERNKAERERKLAAHWAKQERLRRLQMREQAVKDARMRREMRQKIEGRKEAAAARQRTNQAEFLKIRDERAKHRQQKELRIERALTAKMKKACDKHLKKSALRRPVRMSFPPIDKGFKSHVARGSVWSSVETSLETTSLDPATGVWKYPPPDRLKVSSPSISTSSQLSISSAVLPPIITTSDYSAADDHTESSASIDIYPESIHHRTDLSDTITEDSIGELDAVADEGSITTSQAAIEASKIIVEEIVTAVEAVAQTSEAQVDTVAENGTVVTGDEVAVSDTVPEDSKALQQIVTEATVPTESKIRAFAEIYVKQEVLGGIPGPVNEAAYDIVVHGLLDDMYREIAEENPEMIDEDGDVSSTDDLYLDLIARYNEMNIHITDEDSGSHGDSKQSVVDVSYPIEVDEEGESLPRSINQVAEEVVRRVILSVFLYLKTTGELLPDSTVSSLQAEGTSGTRRSSASSSGPAVEGMPGSFEEKMIDMESLSELLEHLPSSAAELYRSSQEASALKMSEKTDRHSSLLLMDSALDASAMISEEEGEEDRGSDVDEGDEDEEVIGIVENEIIAEEQSERSIVCYGELSEVCREREDGSLLIEGAIAETMLDAPGMSLTETVLSIESLHRNKSGQQTSSSSCHLNKSATEGDEEGSGEATGIQYHSVIPVYQTSLLPVSDDLISKHLSLISSKPEGNRLAAAHQPSGRNSFRNVFRPDITYCAQSLQSLQSIKKSVDKNQGELGFLEEEEELNKKDSKEKLITVEETEGVCYLPEKKSYQVTYDLASASIRSLDKEDEGDDSPPLAEERMDTEAKKKRKRKSKKRQPRDDKRDSSDESGSRTGSNQDASISSKSDSPHSGGSLLSTIQSQESDIRCPTEKDEKAVSDSGEPSQTEKSGSVTSVLDSIIAKISQIFGSKKDVSKESLKTTTSKTSQSTQLLADKNSQPQPQVSVKVKDDSDVSPDVKSTRSASDEQCEADIETEEIDQMTRDSVTEISLTEDPDRDASDVTETSHINLDIELPLDEEKKVCIPSSLTEDIVMESVDKPAISDAGESIQSPPSRVKVEETVDIPHGMEKDEESPKSPPDEKIKEPVENLPDEMRMEESVKVTPEEQLAEVSVDGPVIEEHTQRHKITAESGQEEPNVYPEPDVYPEDEAVDNTVVDKVMSETTSEQKAVKESDLQPNSVSSGKISEKDSVAEPSLEGIPTKTEELSSRSMSDMSSSVMKREEQKHVETALSLTSKDEMVGESVSEEKGSREQVKTSQVSVIDTIDQDEVMMKEEAASQDVVDTPTSSRPSATSSKGSSGSISSKKKSSSRTGLSKKSSSVISPSKRSSSIQSNLKSPYSEGLLKRSSSKVGSSKSSSTKVGHSKQSSSASIKSTKRSSSLDGPSKKTSLQAKSSTMASKSLSQGASTKTHSAHAASLKPDTSKIAQRNHPSPQTRSSPTLEQTSVAVTSEASCKSSPCIARDNLPTSSFIIIRSQSKAKSTSQVSPRNKASIREQCKTAYSSPYLKANKSSQSQSTRSRKAVTSASLPVTAGESKDIVKSPSLKGIQKGSVSPSKHRSSSSFKSSSRKSVNTPEECQPGPTADASMIPTARPDESDEPDVTSPVTPVSKPSVETSHVTSIDSFHKASPVASDHTLKVTSVDTSLVESKDTTSQASSHVPPVASVQESHVASIHVTVYPAEGESKHTSPVASDQTSPVGSVHISPVASVHMPPAASSHTSPVGSVHATPVASEHTSPVGSVHTSPVASDHKSPVASNHSSPVRSVHASPVASVHKPSVASGHTSPVESVHSIPVASEHTSPVGSVHMSPVASDHKSPMASDHPSPVGSVHTSPVASLHKSPAASGHTSPVGSVHTSPVASDHPSPVGSVHMSPVASDHKSPVASYHPSPVGSVHTSPVASLHKSPVASSHTSPVGSVHTSPVASDHPSPVGSVHMSPVASDHKSPVASDHPSPVGSVHTSPVASLHKSPVASSHTSPVGSVHTSPVASDHPSPVGSVHTSPVASDHKPLVAPDHTLPEESFHTSEVAFDGKAPVTPDQPDPVASVHISPVASHQASPVASDDKSAAETEPKADHSKETVQDQLQKSQSHVQKKKSSLLSFFRRGSVTKSRSETSDVMKIVQITRRSLSERSTRSLVSRTRSHGHGEAQSEKQNFPENDASRDNKMDRNTSSDADPGNKQTATDKPPSGDLSPSISKTPSKTSLRKQRSNHSQGSLSSNTSRSSKTSKWSSRTSVTSKASKTSRTSRKSSGRSLSKRASDRSKTSVTSSGSKKGSRSRKSSRSSVYEVVEE